MTLFVICMSLCTKTTKTTSSMQASVSCKFVHIPLATVFWLVHTYAYYWPICLLIRVQFSSQYIIVQNTMANDIILLTVCPDDHWKCDDGIGVKHDKQCNGWANYINVKILQMRPTVVCMVSVSYAVTHDICYEHVVIFYNI